MWASFSLHALNYETPPSYHDFPHSRHLILSLHKYNILSHIVSVEGCIITELEDYKECDWCGGFYDIGFDPIGEKKIPPKYFCSYECYQAMDYYGTLLFGVLFAFGSILLLVGAIAFPSIIQQSIQLPGLFIIVLFGQLIGWPMMLCAKGSRKARKSVPRYSRKGRRVDEPLEYHHY